MFFNPIPVGNLVHPNVTHEELRRKLFFFGNKPSKKEGFVPQNLMAGFT